MSSQHSPNPPECGGDAAAYVLGALDPAEAVAFEKHLTTCAVCRDEIEALRGVVQALPMASPQYPAPRRLRRRLMRAIREEGNRERDRGRARAPRWRLRTELAGGLAAACAVAAIVIVLLSGGSGGGGRLIRASTSGIRGTAQVRVTGEHGELVVRHLTPPAPGRVYEVWLKAAHRNPVPASVLFSVSHAGNAEVGLPRSLRGVSVLMVTSEPQGGSSVPTSRPVIVARLT